LLYLKTEQFYKSTSKQLRKGCDDFNVARSTVRDNSSKATVRIC